MIQPTGCSRPQGAQARDLAAQTSASYQFVQAQAHYLEGEDTLFMIRDERINFGNLLTIDADAAIDEKHGSLKAAAIAEVWKVHRDMTERGCDQVVADRAAEARLRANSSARSAARPTS